METKKKMLLSTLMSQGKQTFLWGAQALNCFLLIILPCQNGAVCTAETHIKNIQAWDFLHEVRDT